MNGRDGNWELKQSPRKRDKGGHLGPLSARRGVRARNKYGVHTRMSTKYSTLCACIDRLWDMYVPCTVHVWTAIPCLAPQSNTTQLGRAEDDQFASENEACGEMFITPPRCFHCHYYCYEHCLHPRVISTPEYCKLP